MTMSGSVYDVVCGACGCGIRTCFL